MSDNTPVSDQIASYQLNDISVLTGNINEFCVSINYDFTTDNDNYINPARGAKGKGTWPDNYVEIRIRSIDKYKYKIVSTGTGGGGASRTMQHSRRHLNRLPSNGHPSKGLLLLEWQNWTMLRTTL